MSTTTPTGDIRHLLQAMASLERLNLTHKRSFDSLTERERQVLALVAEGASNPDIALQLKISRATVQNHRANIRQKLNILTEADYVKYALAYDLIRFE